MNKTPLVTWALLSVLSTEKGMYSTFASEFDTHPALRFVIHLTCFLLAVIKGIIGDDSSDDAQTVLPSEKALKPELSETDTVAQHTSRTSKRQHS